METTVMRIRKRRRSLSLAEQALADARDLVAADAPIDAIRLLTEANRVERDRRIERRLVELRFDAYRRTDWPSARPEWPDDVEDLFPGDLIPEIERKDLTVETVRSGIQKHGSILVRGLIGRDHVDRLVTDIDTTFDAFDTAKRGDQRPELAGWYVPFEHELNDDWARALNRKNGNILAVEAPPTLFDLIEIFNEVGVAQLAHDFFGETPAILARKVTLRRMPHTGSGAWHQDGAFMGAGIRSLNVWLALTHCGDDAPSLDVLGRRLDHIVPTGNGATKEWSVKTEDAEQFGAGEIVRPIFEPGDALIFDHMLLHATGQDNTMKKGRYAIEMWWFAPSTYASMTTPPEHGYTPRDQVPLVV
jgi:hypothetical protein